MKRYPDSFKFENLHHIKDIIDRLDGDFKVFEVTTIDRDEWNKVRDLVASLGELILDMCEIGGIDEG